MNSNGPGILCKVCGDRASGKHYGVPSCDGCRGFFKRSIRRNLEYVCKEGGRCIVDVSRRNQCQSCRFAKCLNVNMRREAVQHERAPRCGPPISITSPFALDFCRPSAFSAGSFFVPLAPHAHPPSAPSYMDNAYLSKVTILSENLFGQSLFSPTTSAVHTHDSLSLSYLRVPKAKEDEVTSSAETTSTTHSNESASAINRSKDAVFELAAKVLFLAVQWAKQVPSFSQLPPNDRTILIKESWADLFVLTSAQWNFSETNLPSGIDYVTKLQNAYNLYTASRIDNTEAACLKALILFRPERPGLLARNHIACLQEQTLSLLNEKSGAIRMGHLLLLLPIIKQAADPVNLQDIFFKRTIGEVTVERILEDLLTT